MTLSHDRLRLESATPTRSSEGWLDNITEHLTLRGPLDDEQRQRLLEIAGRCPVHRTLSGQVQFATHLVLEEASAGVSGEAS